MARGTPLAVLVLFAVSFFTPRGAAGQATTPAPNGRIHTKVITAGPAARKVEVELLNLESLAVPPRVGIRADEEFVPASGSVQWSGLPPGRYVLGVNITRPATKDNPYPPTFYPGVRDISAAQIFELGLGQELEVPAFTLPEAPRMLTIHGSIVRTNARPVGGISVSLDSAEPYSLDSQVGTVRAEKDGRFSFTVPAGSRYRVTTVPWNGLRAISEPFELTPATAPVLLVMRPLK